MEHGSLDEYAAHTAKAIESIDGDQIGHDVDLTIEQIITDEGSVVGHYHLRLRAGEASVQPGPSDSADVTIKQDASTAQALRDGRLHAQGAFLTGRLSVDGDISKLVEHGPLLSALLAAQPERT